MLRSLIRVILGIAVIAGLAAGSGFAHRRSIADYAGIPRIVVVNRE